MIPDHVRTLARQYLEASNPGDLLLAQLREECEKIGITTREAFEFAIRHQDGLERRPTPPAPADRTPLEGSITFEAISWEAVDSLGVVELQVPGTTDRFRIATDPETFSRVIRPAIK